MKNNLLKSPKKEENRVVAMKIKLQMPMIQMGRKLKNLNKT
jgi:hypothetical protein